MHTKVGGPLKTHGGKKYLADWIISLMPPRAANPNDPAPTDTGWLHYVECYAGGLSVLLAQDPEGISEVVCDVDGRVTNFWDTLQSKAKFGRLRRLLEVTPVSELEYERSNFRSLRDVEDAARFFVRCRQSMSGRGDSFSPLTRNRTRRGMSEQVSAWLSAIDGLQEVHARLRRVVVLRARDALKVIAQQDGPRSLFYLDPPYHPDTRTAKEVYEHEMTHEQHVALLELLETIEGRFLLSGYHCGVYDRFATSNGWHCHEKTIDNKSGKGKTKQQRVECIWVNY